MNIFPILCISFVAVSIALIMLIIYAKKLEKLTDKMQSELTKTRKENQKLKSEKEDLLTLARDAMQGKLSIEKMEEESKHLNQAIESLTK